MSWNHISQFCSAPKSGTIKVDNCLYYRVPLLAYRKTLPLPQRVATWWDLGSTTSLLGFSGGWTNVAGSAVAWNPLEEQFVRLFLSSNVIIKTNQNLAWFRYCHMFIVGCIAVSFLKKIQQNSHSWVTRSWVDIIWGLIPIVGVIKMAPLRQRILPQLR